VTIRESAVPMSCYLVQRDITRGHAFAQDYDLFILVADGDVSTEMPTRSNL